MHENSYWQISNKLGEGALIWIADDGNRNCPATVNGQWSYWEDDFFIASFEEISVTLESRNWLNWNHWTATRNVLVAKTTTDSRSTIKFIR